MTPRFRKIAITAVAVAVSLGLVPSAFAAVEDGDAGDLPSTAQDLGSGEVQAIFGTFSGGGDVDVYRVCLTDGPSFFASTVGATTLDTQLFLFDANGRGVYSNDDAMIGVRGSRLPSGHRFSPSAPGEYFVALSSFNNDPQSDAGEIFPDLFSGSLYPDGVVDAAGVGGDEPIVSWSGPTRGPPGLYRINLTGTTACDLVPPTVDLRSPEDGSHVAQGAPLVVDFSCDDSGGSGLESCEGSVPDGELLDTSELGDVSVTVTARDNAGNETVVTNTVTVVDETKPTISLTTPAAGATYELGAVVLADYTCADEPNGSGLDSCVGTVANGAAVDTGSLGQKTFTVDASDHGGEHRVEERQLHGRRHGRTEHRRDHARTRSGLRGRRVGGRRLLVLGCRVRHRHLRGQRARRRAHRHRLPGQKTFTVNATDNAGNPASKSVTYSVADGKAPTITFAKPTDGAVYALGQKVVVGYSCADEPNGSGVASCEGTLPVGARLDTSRFGAKTFTVRTTDRAGTPPRRAFPTPSATTSTASSGRW